MSAEKQEKPNNIEKSQFGEILKKEMTTNYITAKTKELSTHTKLRFKQKTALTLNKQLTHF